MCCCLCCGVNASLFPHCIYTHAFMFSIQFSRIKQPQFFVIIDFNLNFLCDDKRCMLTYRGLLYSLEFGDGLRVQGYKHKCAKKMKEIGRRKVESRSWERKSPCHFVLIQLERVGRCLRGVFVAVLLCLQLG